ncbi:MAG: class SAM-dependent methyltransferase [Aeromicrobium sp.]|nr:class SAM-dependent methyltransferase [Aeromicrobium sp.]
MTQSPADKTTPRGGLRRLARRVVGTPSSVPGACPDRIGPQGIPGRILRVTHEPENVDLPADREVSDPSEAAAVRAGWLLIDAYERLSRTASERIFKHELDAWHEYSETTVSPLEYLLPSGKTLRPESKKNRLRFRRTMDFARSGENVFDIGFGRGLLAAQLIKDRGVKSYHGIDIVSGYVPTAGELFEVNGLAEAAIELEIGDLYNLTRERVEASGASLVICCEVLEHVPDAERALRTIADALPDGADFLFSVPLHGRLESTWGHLSVFDVARLKQMLDGAGLYAHHVEPLAATWSLVVASRDPGPSVRVREAANRPAIRTSRPLSTHRDFIDIGSDEMTALGGTKLGRRSDQLAHCQVSSGGGISFSVKSLESMRLKFIFPEAQKVTRFVVTARAGDKALCEWTWTPAGGEVSKGTQRVSMRPGEVGAEFISGPHNDTTSADQIDLVVETPDGKSIEFDLSAAYLP